MSGREAWLRAAAFSLAWIGALAYEGQTTALYVVGASMIVTGLAGAAWQHVKAKGALRIPACVVRTAVGKSSVMGEA